MRRNGSEFYYQVDHIGSVVAITDASGAVLERYFYDVDGTVKITDANGNERSSSSIDNDFTFIGGLWDPVTGLINLGERDYSPRLGRFLQPDPAGTMDGLNLYAYSGNDPLNYSDPTGLYRQASAENMRIGSMSWRGVSIQRGVEIASMVTGAIVDLPKVGASLGKGLSSLVLKYLDSGGLRGLATRVFSKVSQWMQWSKSMPMRLKLMGHMEITFQDTLLLLQSLKRANVVANALTGEGLGTTYLTGVKHAGKGFGKFAAAKLFAKNLWRSVNPLQRYAWRPGLKIGSIEKRLAYLSGDIDIISGNRFLQAQDSATDAFRWWIAHVANASGPVDWIDEWSPRHGILNKTFKNAYYDTEAKKWVDLNTHWLFTRGGDITKAAKGGKVPVGARELVRIDASELSALGL